MFSKHLFKTWFNFARICKTPQEAIQGVKDGAFILSGGFGICGVPMNLINAVRQAKIKNLTVASNNAGLGDKEGKLDWGLGILLRTKQIKRMIASFIGENYQFEKQYFTGELELEICPQGTLAEKIRSGGAGIPAFYTLTGVDTLVEKGGFPIKFKHCEDYDAIKKGTVTLQPEIVAEPKSTKIIKGTKYILEDTFFADFAFVKAKRADTKGNLQFSMTQRNFNEDMAKAARCVIAEVEQIVEAGELDPENIHVPGVYVHRIFKNDPSSPYSEIKIEKLIVSDQSEVKVFVGENQLKSGKLQFNPVDPNKKTKTLDPIRLKIARRAAQEVKDGMNINLGIGIPTLLPAVLPEGISINLHSENGVLGIGPVPTLANATGRNITTSKGPITIEKGGSYFSSSESFSIVRGGHLDMTMLGSMEVSETCDIANWMIPKKMLKGMGGAMDLVASGSKVVVLMEHAAATKDGKIVKKLLPECKLPLTAKGVVSKVITQLAVFENVDGKLVLTEIAEGISFEEVQSKTGFKITAADNIKTF